MDFPNGLMIKGFKALQFLCLLPFFRGAFKTEFLLKDFHEFISKKHLFPTDPIFVLILDNSYSILLSIMHVFRLERRRLHQNGRAMCVRRNRLELFTYLANAWISSIRPSLNARFTISKSNRLLKNKEE